MKNKLKITIGILNYIISIILIGYYLVLEFSILNLTSPIRRIKIILIVIILMYIGSSILLKENKKIFGNLPKINMWIWFSLYITMILNLTLFDEYFGRTGIAMISSTRINIKNYFSTNCNIIPFATIKNYILALKNNNLASSTFIYNIFGNILAFTPLSLFLPRLFNIIDKWYKFLIVTSIFVILIEIMQMVTMSGSLDIDDYILNIFGALIAYIILNNKFILNKINVFLNQEYLKK